MVRYYKRRYYRRRYNRFTFSKFNTYKNRSSKSQARQIYQLNKKINRIEAKTKPEFKTGRKDSLLTLNSYFTNNQLWTHGLSMITSTDGVNLHDEAIQHGLFCRLCGLTLWGNVERVNVNATHTAGFLRLIILQFRQARQDSLTMADMFSGYNEQDMNSSIMKEPFKDHISASVKIIANKVYKINNNDINNVPFKVSIPGKKLLNFSENSTEPVAKGDILVCAILGQDKATDATAYRMKLSCKLCYTDA